MVDAVNGADNSKLSVVKGTLASGGIGAVAGAGLEYYSQKQILNRGADYFEKQIVDMTEKLKSAPKDSISTKMYQKCLDYMKKCMDSPKMKELFETGKVNPKMIMKAAGITGLAFAGVYLACKGIKALIHKDK